MLPIGGRKRRWRRAGKPEVLRFVVLGSAYPSRGKESADLFQRGIPCSMQPFRGKNALQLTTQQARLNSQNLFNITTGSGRRQQSGVPDHWLDSGCGRNKPFSISPIPPFTGKSRPQLCCHRRITFAAPHSRHKCTNFPAKVSAFGVLSARERCVWPFTA
jgi:hypothetical protein